MSSKHDSLMKSLFIFIVLALFSISNAKDDDDDNVALPKNVDLNALVTNGLYYNILSKPDEIDKICFCTTALFTWKDVNENLNVDETCNLISASGPLVTERSELRIEDDNDDDSTNNARLTRYDLKGTMTSPYDILQFAVDYSWIAVGDPEQQTFWLLSNQPTLGQTVIDSVLQNQSQLNGYDFTDVLYTDQSCF